MLFPNLKFSFSLIRIAAVLAFLPLTLAARQAHADTISYNLTLTPNTGSSIGGTGTLVLNAAPSATGETDYSSANGSVSGLTFSIDGQTFSLAGSTGTATVQFIDGQLTDITFAEQLGNDPYEGDRFTLDTTSGYVFYYDDNQAESIGTITAAPAPSSPAASPVPEPSSAALLGTGLLAFAGLVRRWGRQ